MRRQTSLGSFALLAGRRNGAPGWIAEAHRDLHAFRHRDVQHGYFERADYGHAGHPGDHLGAPGPHSARHRPGRGTVECNRECGRYHVVQSGAGYCFAGGHTTTDRDVYSCRRDRLPAGNSTKLAHHYSSACNPPVDHLECSGAGPIRHRLEQRSIGRHRKRCGYLQLLTSRRGRTPGRLPEADGDFHPRGHDHLFHRYLERADHGHPGHPGGHLGRPVRH